MATRAIERGPTAQRVADNVRALRERQRLTRAALAERMRLLGRPVSGNGLLKMEDGTRRIDADDLMALAVALQVTPNRLLLSGAEDDLPGRKLPLTANMTIPWEDAWLWASGEARLFGRWPESPEEFGGLDTCTVGDMTLQEAQVHAAGGHDPGSQAAAAHRAAVAEEESRQEDEFLKEARPHDPNHQLDGPALRAAANDGSIQKLAAAADAVAEHGFTPVDLPDLVRTAQALLAYDEEPAEPTDDAAAPEQN